MIEFIHVGDLAFSYICNYYTVTTEQFKGGFFMSRRNKRYNMIVRPPQGKEVVHLWIAISIVIVLSLYTLAVQLMEPLQDYFVPYTKLPIVKAAVFILYFWLLSLMWIAYRRWQEAIELRREMEMVISSISPDALLVVAPNRKISMCNTSVKNMFGYEPEEIINQTTDMLYFDRRVNRKEAEIARCLRKFGFHVGYATGKRKDGETFPLEIITGDLSGQPGAVVLARDITERKQAEEALRISYEKQQSALRQLRQTQQQVVQHERLRILGKMASYIAHEFNNALTPIMGFSEMLLGDFDNLKGSDDLRGYLEDIHTAATDASSVVRRLREFYKVREEDTTTSVMDLNQTIEETISLTRPKWKSEAQSTGRDVSFDLDLGEVPSVPGNPEEFREVLTNLIFNAVNAMPEGGTIKIATELKNGLVELRIEDNGSGMPPEVETHCFEPFYSTSGANGSGLGLVVVSSIVSRHRGRIECKSEEGKGTTFTITLPVSDKQQVKTKSAAPAVPSRLLRVLVVDDEMLIRKLMVQFLESDGHTVDTAGTGRNGLEKFRDENYDLVITDWAMPEMNGAELSDAIKSESPKTPVVLMTGFDSGRREEAGTHMAADIVLGKPITRQTLLKTINDVLAMNEKDILDVESES